MSYTETQATLSVFTDIERETILSKVEECLTPLAEEVAAINKADEEGKPLPHTDVEGALELAEELDYLTETDDVLDVFTNTISFPRISEPGSCLELRCGGQTSLSTNAFDALASSLASLSNKPYSSGFYAEDDSKDGMFAYEFVVTKNGTKHTLEDLAQAALSAL